MWSIADSGDAAARDNFEHLFPDFGNELLRRIRMVSELKEAKELHLQPVQRPVFEPNTAPKAPFIPRKALYVSCALLGAAFAAAALYRPFSQSRAAAQVA